MHALTAGFGVIALALMLAAQAVQWVSRELRDGRLGQVEGVAFSPNGQWLASADNDGALVVYSVDDGRVVRRLRGRNFTEVAWTPDARTIVVGGFDSLVYVWDWERDTTGRKVSYRGQVEAVAIAGDRMLLAAGGGDRTIRRWELPGLRELPDLQGHTDDVYAVRVSPDGRTLVSGGRDRTIRVWRMADGQPVRVLHGHDDSVYDLAFSPDGRQLFSGCRDGNIGVWDTATWHLVRLLGGPDNSIHAVAVDPQGRWLAAAGFDRHVWIWRVPTERPGFALQGHRRKVSGVAFSPDGRQLASAASDTAVRIWAVPVR